MCGYVFQKHKWPKSWEYIQDPVVPLERNLYGHPLAGLLWERQIAKALMELGCEKVPNWECLFVHRKQKLFLSVCVDDIKMAGTKQNLAPMWEKLMKDVDILEPTKFLDHVYLGCTQRECKPNDKKFWTIQQDVWILYFCWSNWAITGMGQNLARKLQCGPTTWKDILENAWSGTANWQTKRREQLYKVSHLCLDDHQIKKEELENKCELSEVCSHIA